MFGKESKVESEVDKVEMANLIEGYRQAAEERITRQNEQVLFLDCDWGIALEKAPRKIAKEQGLVAFQGKWVTKEERKILQKESQSFSAIRWLAWALIVGGGLIGIVGTLAAIDKHSVSVAIIFGLFGAAAVVVGIGLYGLKQWARYAAVTIFLVSAIVPILFMSPASDPDSMKAFGSVWGACILGLIMCLNLFLKNGRKIFRTRKSVTRADDALPTHPA